MTKNNKIKTAALIIASVFIIASFILIPLDNKMYAIPPQHTVNATLTGSEEIPPVDTQGTGIAAFQADKNTMKFQISVLNTGKVIGIHIHNGKIGENGYIIVSLYKPKNVSTHINKNFANLKHDVSNIQKSSTFSLSGNFHDSDIMGPMKGKTIKDLITTIENGEAYVNVHTKDYPDGEIRGQLISVASPETDSQNK